MAAFTGVFDRKAFEDVGGRFRMSQAPDPVTLDWLKGQCASLEKHLRNQDPAGRKLPPALESELSFHPPTTTTGALRRWTTLKRAMAAFHASGDMTAGHGPDAAKVTEATRQLLRREPVTLELAGRAIEVTGRSYDALYHIQRHAARVMELEEASIRCGELETRLIGEAARLPLFGRGRPRRRLRRVVAAHQRILAELALHRQAIYAHAFTASGAPATSLDEAPGWWREIGPAEDAAFMLAVLEVGPLRVQRLGPAPGARKGAGGSWGELFAAMAGRQKLEDPAAYFARDIGQVVAFVRTLNPESPLEDLE